MTKAQGADQRGLALVAQLQRAPGRLLQSAPHCQHRHKRLHNCPTYADPKTKRFLFYSFFIQMVSDDFPWLFI